MGMAVVLGILILAYGFQVTQVDFQETRSENRLTQLTRIIRALAQPRLFEYERTEVFVETPVYLPCPPGEVDIPDPDKSGPYLVLDPPCAGAGEFIVVEGHNFEPETRGPINFIPPSGAVLTIGNFEVDSGRSFVESVKLPNRQPVEEAQIIRIIARQNVGMPSFSSVARSTWEKIIETVFLALIATAAGTLLAIPISFFAAQNLMSDMKSPLTSVALTIIGWPIGIALAVLAVQWVGIARDLLMANWMLSVGAVIILTPLGWVTARFAMPAEESRQPKVEIRILRTLAMILVAAIIILVLYLLANLMFISGEVLLDNLGLLGFIGYFLAQLGEILRMVTPAVAAMAGGSVLGGVFGKVGMLINERAPINAIRLLNLLLAALAGALIAVIIGAGIEWLYQIGNPMTTRWIPALVGALLGVLVSLSSRAKDLIPIGSVIYIIMRTILNAIRSIEPLIYVIVFVVWVGIGPFAGALALALHTIAALAKLYSEQVESISPGPLEAVTATGATRLQTIVYAVVPQIIPPYISFTMYRWDINVRMSTIIGFAGGGGIGFLLQQNIRLLDYRAASVQMLAIAVVVASMDYTSAWIRQRFV